MIMLEWNAYFMVTECSDSGPRATQPNLPTKKIYIMFTRLFTFVVLQVGSPKLMAISNYYDASLTPKLAQSAETVYQVIPVIVP
jgi:hypothetical protein